MIACILIPGFALRAALLARPGLALRPAALAPLPGTEQLLGPVTAAAEAAGIRPGMRLGEALATCPSLVLVDPDPAGAEREWEGILLRLEDAAFAVFYLSALAFGILIIGREAGAEAVHSLLFGDVSALKRAVLVGEGDPIRCRRDFLLQRDEAEREHLLR